MQEEKFLQDQKNGKEVDWKGHKSLADAISRQYTRVGCSCVSDFEKSRFSKRAAKVNDCGTLLEFRRYADGARKLNRANFCKVRLCPMCAWRRSLKIFGQVSKVMDEVKKDRDYRHIFLTLTARNVKAEALRGELTAYFKAFDRLMKRKVVMKAVKGWFRALEVTRNAETGEYHPHFHVVLVVNKSYFTMSELYITQENWSELWRSSLGLDYTPIVFVEKIEPNKGTTDDYGKGVAEVSKYAVKAVDYIDSEEAIETLDLALERRRLIAFGGIFKDAHKRLNLDNPVDGDLIRTDNNDELRADLGYIIELYSWRVGYGNYVLVRQDE